MLRPTKHSHPDRTVVYAALIALKRLKSRRIEDFSSLREYLRKTVSGADFLIIPAVNLLFLLGLIEYRPKTDSFEYVGKNETI